MRHRALAKLMHEPQLRQDHLAVADALAEILEEGYETKAICKAADGCWVQPKPCELCCAADSIRNS